MLRAAAELFAIDCPPARLAEVVEGPLFGTYAKNPSAAFTNADRIARRDDTRLMLRREITAAQSWLGTQAPDLGTLTEALASRRLA